MIVPENDPRFMVALLCLVALVAVAEKVRDGAILARQSAKFRARRLKALKTATRSR